MIIISIIIVGMEDRDMTTTRRVENPQSNTQATRDDRSYCRDCGADGPTQLQPHRGVYLCATCFAADMTPEAPEAQ